MKVIAGTALLGGMLIAAQADAGPKCDHPNFYAKGCEYPELRGDKGDKGDKGEQGDRGPQGVPGADGADGVNGVDGVDGRDGINGADGAVGARGERGEKGERGERGLRGPSGTDGRDGIDGRDGADGKNGLEYRNEFMRYIAATNALDIHEAQDGHRFTVNASRLSGRTGVGLGYSYRTQKDSLIKFGAARSGSETLLKGSISWEIK